MNKNGSGGSQIAAAMAILFFTGFVRICCEPEKNKEPAPSRIAHCGTKRL
jgi:hypothetical protein